MTVRLTIDCLACHSQYRLVVPDKPTVQAPPAFCCYCGAQKVNQHPPDADQDLWEIMSEEYHLSVDILKLFYDAWNQNNEGCRLYKDYLFKKLKELVK